MRAVRVNGQITEVMHTKMGDYLGSIHFVFFSSLAEILGKLAKFYSSVNFEKLNYLWAPSRDSPATSHGTIFQIYA